MQRVAVPCTEMVLSAGTPSRDPDTEVRRWDDRGHARSSGVSPSALARWWCRSDPGLLACCSSTITIRCAGRPADIRPAAHSRHGSKSAVSSQSEPASGRGGCLGWSASGPVSVGQPAVGSFRWSPLARAGPTPVWVLPGQPVLALHPSPSRPSSRLVFAPLPVLLPNRQRPNRKLLKNPDGQSQSSAPRVGTRDPDLISTLATAPGWRHALSRLSDRRPSKHVRLVHVAFFFFSLSSWLLRSIMASVWTRRGSSSSKNTPGPTPVAGADQPGPTPRGSPALRSPQAGDRPRPPIR